MQSRDIRAFGRDISNVTRIRLQETAPVLRRDVNCGLLIVKRLDLL